ncbi:hypothetical protein P170DRAFT_355451 [Aspergillus steynii IBT 23096]|uniref:Something about silencing protein 4 domain-containing protein n=1 Tax=Aspergillus steynii IBT 23096 TaxID=1392250 RepID=A0A2I2GCU0_9EURO|nr:uncharacterized protein P170DRAFT_355451 [Aspergillus steynii IBT 23096]PLB50691.1 hypothetical protein P170DRAFT_355451 [Aspergillus steynii IBT 23096]
MTSTTVMTIRSRSTLRVNEGVAPPPSKRPRLHAPVARRKSSPDLLDTTIDDSPSKPIVPLRHSTRRPGPLSSPSFNTNAASSSHPPPSTPRSKDLRIHRRETPSTAALFLRGGRESPDPLDTISPTTEPVRSPGRPSSVRRPAPTPESGRRRMQKTARSSDSPAAFSSHLPDPAPAQDSPGIVEDAPPAASSGPPQSQSESQSEPQPQPQQQQQQRRSLRSHDGGSRARSELALYFPNYEQLLSFEPPKTEFLAGQTKIKLIDDLSESPVSSLASPAHDTESPFGNPLVNLHNCETIALPAPAESEETPRKTKVEEAEKEEIEDEDPLNEATYFRAHRRNERQEKQLRNIERERAQHEKQQLDRLVDELQGQDWLRVMGISGATDQEKKHYELKRDFCVKELSALIQKFKIWREEEKRRKADKEKLRVESAEDLDATPQQHHPHPPSASASTSQKRRSTDVVVEDSEDPDESPVTLLSDAPSYGETPDVNDVDAWAARQLHQEARSATAGKKPKGSSSATPAGEGGRKKSKPSNIPNHSSNSTNNNNNAAEPVASTAAAAAPAQPPIPLLPPVFVPDKPFTSFFSKRHVRDAALSTHRKGRVRLAFGHLIPEPEEREFELPADILTPEAIDSCRRKRRRMKRASRTGTVS